MPMNNQPCFLLMLFHQQFLPDPVRPVHNLLSAGHRRFYAGIEISRDQVVFHGESREPHGVHEGRDPSFEEPFIRLVLGEDERDLF